MSESHLAVSDVVPRLALEPVVTDDDLKAIVSSHMANLFLGLTRRVLGLLGR